MTLEMIPDKQTALKLLNKYDPSPSHDLAERFKEGITGTEAENWFMHPLTQSLIASLDGDLAGIVQGIVSEHYLVENSVDASAQNLAKALGMASAITQILDHVREMREIAEEEENESKRV